MKQGAREQIRLADGRRLSFLQAGAAAGAPVMYFHGSPSSASECRLFGTSADVAASGIRLIAVDRPGSAGSSFQIDRRISDWPADVTALASQLRLDRFAVLGYSGGGPYALACARQLPERLTVAVTVSGTAPFESPGVTDGISPDSWRFMQLARLRPRLARAISWLMGLTARVAPGRMAAQAIRSLPQADAAVLADPELAGAFACMVYETTHGSPRGAQHDTALMIGPWGFDPAEITKPVTMWHGTEDRNAPPAMARWLARRMPRVDLRWLEGEGHISAAVNHADRILHGLAGLVDAGT
ncbi:MAG TPA: alpha/beta hydrolase [Candidatus Limnocylindria bacterium]